MVQSHCAITIQMGIFGILLKKWGTLVMELKGALVQTGVWIMSIYEEENQNYGIKIVFPRRRVAGAGGVPRRRDAGAGGNTPRGRDAGAGGVPR